ncbi:MAG: phosphate ABC transporter substrate-binding protein PstS [Firmicutes bacterium]|nr:phosphate ABC transporter substrate-binding protein PstS [Bacillota bacterium]
MEAKRAWRRWASAGAATILAAAVAAPAATWAAGRPAVHRSGSSVTLLETGSTLLYPLFNLWVPAYTHTHPGVKITTAATGSGTGISEATSGAVQIGASDAYLPPAHPSTLMNIPLAISAQQVNYNVPGLNGVHLKLSGPVLAGIYTGRIKTWNAAPIRALNPGVKLPAHAIVPLRRADASGDTFIFTQYLTFSAGKAWPAGYGTSVSWPALPSLVAEPGNSGMVSGLKSIPYSVAYVGVSYLNETNAAHLGEAKLENRAGNFVLPVAATIETAAKARVGQTPPDEALSLVYAPGKDAYPIINYEYAIVSQKQASAAVAAAVRSFLTWALTVGNGERFLSQVHFQPLPPAIVKMSKAQIAKVR